MKKEGFSFGFNLVTVFQKWFPAKLTFCSKIQRAALFAWVVGF